MTLILVGVVLAATSGGPAGGSKEIHRFGTTVEAYGLSISVPDGWQARIYRLAPDDAITLEAASVDLPPRGEMMTGERLGPDDAYIRIDDIGPPPNWGGESSLPLSIGPEDIQGPYEGGFPTGAGFSALINHRALNIRADFATQRLEEVNRVLATFAASPP
jgi:hypothetical protein